MKSKLNIILMLFSIITIQSCDNAHKFYQMFNENGNVEIISKNVEAKSFKMATVNEINHISNDTTSFIELTFLNSKLFRKENIDKAFLASYCAIQAYQLFNPKIWYRKDGISVIFKNDKDKNEFKKYYKITDLQNIKKAITNFDSLIALLEITKVSKTKNSGRINIEDSLKIASFFSKKIFQEKHNIVSYILQAYKSYDADLDSANRKYFFKVFTMPDTIGSKIVNSRLYQIKSSLVIPTCNCICKMECVVNSNNIEKFVGITIYKKEETNTAVN